MNVIVNSILFSSFSSDDFDFNVLSDLNAMGTQKKGHIVELLSIVPDSTVHLRDADITLDSTNYDLDDGKLTVWLKIAEN